MRCRQSNDEETIQVGLREIQLKVYLLALSLY